MLALSQLKVWQRAQRAALRHIGAHQLIVKSTAPTAYRGARADVSLARHRRIMYVEQMETHFSTGEGGKQIIPPGAC
jgi:hypothetical protein